MVDVIHALAELVDLMPGLRGHHGHVLRVERSPRNGGSKIKIVLRSTGSRVGHLVRDVLQPLQALGLRGLHRRNGCLKLLHAHFQSAHQYAVILRRTRKCGLAWHLDDQCRALARHLSDRRLALRKVRLQHRDLAHQGSHYFVHPCRDGFQHVFGGQADRKGLHHAIELEVIVTDGHGSRAARQLQATLRHRRSNLFVRGAT
mmetsp:Transcript_95601/g.274392  ORF Transcript_95601/g.274392 Transcript_95601/m.274392 type:complete len:202 (-) Transcript_95601:5-610(-)